MPRKGPAYPISKEWRAEVREAIDGIIADKNNDITTDAAFARHAGIAKSSLNEALAPSSIQSTVMPQINEALGWPVPRVLSTPDELELWAVIEALPDFERGEILGEARSTLARLRGRPRRRS